VFGQVRVPHILGKKLMKFVSAIAACRYNWILVAQLVQDAGRQLFVHKPVGERSDITRPLYGHSIIVPSPKSKELFIELVGKAFCPREKLFCNVRFQNLIEFVSGSDGLISSYLINESDCCPSLRMTTTASLEMTMCGWRLVGFGRHGGVVVGTVSRVGRHGVAWLGHTCPVNGPW